MEAGNSGATSAPGPSFLLWSGNGHEASCRRTCIIDVASNRHGFDGETSRPLTSASRLITAIPCNHGRRYRCHATDTGRPEARKAERWRIPARILEPLVLKSVNLLLNNGTEVIRMIQQYAEARKLHQLQISAKKFAAELPDLESTRQQMLIRTLIQSIRIETDQLTFSLRAKLLTDLLMAVDDHGAVGLALHELSEQISASNNPDAQKTDELAIATFIQPPQPENNGTPKAANREGIPKAGYPGAYFCLSRETFSEISVQAPDRFEEFKPGQKSVVLERKNGG